MKILNLLKVVGNYLVQDIRILKTSQQHFCLFPNFTLYANEINFMSLYIKVQQEFVGADASNCFIFCSNGSLLIKDEAVDLASKATINGFTEKG